MLHVATTIFVFIKMFAFHSYSTKIPNNNLIFYYKMNFIKMHGLMNDYIFFDIINYGNKDVLVSKLTNPEKIQELCPGKT